MATRARSEPNRETEENKINGQNIKVNVEKKLGK